MSESNQKTLFLMWGGTLLVVAAIGLPLAWRGQDAPTTAPVEDAPQAAAATTNEVWTEPIIPIPLSVPLNRDKVALGRRLFHERRLSQDDTVSCATCHSLDLGGTDQRALSVGIGGAEGDLNAPTVFNSAFNFRQFWDGRAATLEEQLDGPVHNPKEMNSSWKAIVEKLGRDERYVREFDLAFPRSGLTTANVKGALVEFERSLITPNSRFDRYLRGERTVLTADEIAGYRVFKDAGCVTCHQGVNAGANMFQKLGRLAAYFGDGRAAASTDLGRFNVTGREDDKHKFKVPTLRNVALTGPYFHDGSVETLADAVRIMSEYQLGVELSAVEIAQVVAFLETLTGVYENPDR